MSYFNKLVRPLNFMRKIVTIVCNCRRNKLNMKNLMRRKKTRQPYINAKQNYLNLFK